MELSIEQIGTLAAVVWALVQMVKPVLPALLDPRGVAIVISVVLAGLMQAGLLPGDWVKMAGMVIFVFLGPSAVHGLFYKPGLGGETPGK